MDFFQFLQNSKDSVDISKTSNKTVKKPHEQNQQTFTNTNIDTNVNNQEVEVYKNINKKTKSSEVPKNNKEEKEVDKDEFKNQILSKFRKHLDVYPDKRVSKIFNMRYENTNKLTPWRKISKEMDLSIQGCINIHNSALKTISKKIKLEYEINS